MWVALKPRRHRLSEQPYPDQYADQGQAPTDHDIAGVMHSEVAPGQADAQPQSHQADSSEPGERKTQT